MQKVGLLLIVFIVGLGYSTYGATAPNTVGVFNKIWIRDGIQVILQKGTIAQVEVVSGKDDENEISIQNTNERLIIKQKEHFGSFFSRKIKPLEAQLKVIVTYTSLNEIFVSGASTVDAKEVINAENLLILVSGNSKVNINTNVSWLSLNLSGASFCKVSGNCTKLNIKSSEASRINTQNLLSKDIQVDLSGASNAEVYAKNNLILNLSGASILKYKAEDSTKVSKTISGASTLIKL